MAASAAAAENTTILRIKRRRRDDHETLDALVIESSSSSSARPAKRSRAGELASTDADGVPAGPSMNKGIFRFAATVSPSTFTSEDSKRSLRDRITSLILHPPPRAGSGSATPQRGSKFALAGTDSSDGKSGPSTPSSAKASPALQQHEKARKQARYKLIQEKRSMSALGDLGSKPSKKESWRRPTAPPVVRSTVPDSSITRSDSFRILEAAIESDSDLDEAPAETWQKDPMIQRMQAYSRSRQKSSNLHVKGRRADETSKSKQQLEEEEMMSNFIPMLQEYLSVSDKTLSSAGPGHAKPANPSPDIAAAPAGLHQQSHLASLPDVPDLSSGDADDSDSEYVYDVYYRDPAPTAATSGAATPSFSTTSSQLHDVYGIDVSSAAGMARIGALTGLEDDELLAGAGADDDDSDEDMVNTDDEDSNEEDFYRNDYPEGEDDEDDEEHMSSAAEEDDDDDDY